MMGTKPHALGAALFATVFDDVELVYDHPIRKQNRSSGAGRCHVYHVSNSFTSHLEEHSADTDVVALRSDSHILGGQG